MRIVPPSDAPITWAVTASAIVHAGLAVMLVGEPSGAFVPAAHVDTSLQARLEAPSPPMEPLAAMRPSPFVLPRFAPLAALGVPLPDAAESHDSAASTGGARVGDLSVTGTVLVDRNRLGPLLTRQLSEFPVEIDSPVRLAEAVVARLPASAFDDPSREPIVVWAVVGWNGVVDEVQLASGDPGVAETVIEAVKQARFIPARDGLLAYRYPIALEFRAPAVVAPAAATARADVLSMSAPKPAATPRRPAR